MNVIQVNCTESRIGVIWMNDALTWLTNDCRRWSLRMPPDTPDTFLRIDLGFTFRVKGSFISTVKSREAIDVAKDLEGQNTVPVCAVRTYILVRVKAVSRVPEIDTPDFRRPTLPAGSRWKLDILISPIP